jgi:predicted ester cyclase
MRSRASAAKVGRSKESIAVTSEDNKALVRRLYQAFEADDEATLNTLLAPNLVAYSHHAPGPQNREQHVQGIRFWNASFGNTRFAIQEQVAEGNKVATRVIMRSVHSRGEFQGLAPTGRQIAVSGITIETIEGGLILERRVETDWLAMLQQLGLMPAAADASGQGEIATPAGRP